MSENNTQGVLAIAKEFGLDGLVSVGMDYIPFLSTFNNMRKFNRLERRMKEHSSQLKKISQLSHDSTLANEYISERIFPIVLADLIEEHEDAKINLILNGFENVFIEEKSEESIVINYYDTLRNLRYKDIRRLLDLVGITGSFHTGLIITEEVAVISGIDAKLESYGLLRIDRVPIGEGKGEYEFVNPSHIYETHYGNSFLQFILSKEKNVAEW
ncbi:hypothetical protein COL64_14725 [Bacillus toyonensis]|uniref:hypothetical protein n=1 Tax=Bacillus toyonensis TaxID=155322 RepID=UPI000BF07E4C|nr:hypothetical protein [Bacillus toyonensis]PEK41954.1 hypothetical protein CN588_26820 [Bacillus toyonensis]PFZ36673.1 hypothetical protein COL64_14725 [Bacillus toyonensis]